jgi:hypothetical protein
MANVSLGPQSAPANTEKIGAAPSTIATHVAGHKVRIDPTALRHLIDTLRAKLRSQS